MLVQAVNFLEMRNHKVESADWLERLTTTYRCFSAQFESSVIMQQ